MKKVRIEEAVGSVLAHDMTKIVPQEFKGVAFKKGHIIKEEDLEAFKDMGKFHVFVFELGENELHENDGATRLAKAVAGENMILTEAKEGKVDITSNIFGRFKLSVEGLEKINDGEGLILATRHRDTVVKPGDMLAGAKIIPLVIEKERIIEVENYVHEFGKIMEVIPFRSLKVGILVTGSEVYYHRIEDRFAAVLERKVLDYNGNIIVKRFAPDELQIIEKEIQEMLEFGCELILVSGGMSVDPDDLTPTAIRNKASEVITYGSPVLPGAMFLMAYLGNVAIMGVPACGMFNKVTILDLMLPIVFSGDKVTSKIIKNKAHGGLCLKCEVCVYPHCEFGKG